MTSIDELETLKARVKELEVGQAAPVKGSGSLLSLIGGVVSIVPRRLFVAAGVLFVAWLSFNLYMNARQKIAQTEIAQQQAEIARQQALKAETEAAAISTPPGRTTLQVQEAVGEKTRLETCKQAGIAPENCPKF
jgi:hypothetical protein